MPTPDSRRSSRAKHACRICNARRVRCDVTEVHPCSNCRASDATCEVLPSRRGRYHRKPRREQPNNPGTSSVSVASPTNSGLAETPSSSAQGDQPSINGVGRVDLVLQARPSSPPLLLRQQQDTTPTPRLPSASGTAGTIFFGESNFLTLVQGGGGGGGVTQPQNGDQAAPATHDREQRGRLLFPLITGGTPQSHTGGVDASPAASISHPNAATARYLHEEGALTIPDLKSCLPALRAYFTWFHPCFPVLDRADISQRLPSMDISRLLLQAMLFIGATYCDDATILAMGFKDRSAAKSLLYTRARLLFHADCERDEITLIQSLFLMSFWRGDKFDVRDVRYWLGVVITFAESSGLHRSTRLATRDPQLARLRRRIWWSIYVRERQSAASLGLPSRIRDEDCDVELLTAVDLESDVEEPCSMPLGEYGPEHVTYAIKMVEMAQLLGKVIDLHFVPCRPASTPEEVRALDESVKAWERSWRFSVKGVIEDGTASIWSCLLQLAYNHLRILIHRPAFLRNDDNQTKQVALAAASQISRIAEDMLTDGSLRYGQMHLITSLFSALCVHAISIRRSESIPRRIAEHKAQMCLLALKDIQKYWRINNRVLDLFLQYLDESTAQRLRGSQGEAGGLDEEQTTHHPQGIISSDHTLAQPASQNMSDFTDQGPVRAATGVFEGQYFDMLSSHWEGDDALHDLGLFLDPQLQDGSMQIEGLNLLGRSL